MHIEIIGVSARFSWRMIEDHFPSLLAKYKKNTIVIDVAVTSKLTLERWSLRKWVNDLDRTLSGLDSFVHDHSAEVAAGRLFVRHFNYDNIPHWHGVLLNKEVLFMGRTEWIFRADDAPDLRVGQCPYRLFELTDRYGGQARIAMFANWIERLRRRNDELRGYPKGHPPAAPGAAPDPARAAGDGQ